ncbi:MAG: hypothetical protein ACRYGK_10340 [Janthinobacterium lividum]
MTVESQADTVAMCAVQALCAAASAHSLQRRWAMTVRFLQATAAARASCRLQLIML